MFFRSLVSWLAELGLTVSLVRLVSDVRSELMCTQAAAMSDGIAEPDGMPESDGIGEWAAGAAFALGLEPEVEVLLQPAISAAPHISATAARRAALGERCGPPGLLIIISLVMLPMPTLVGDRVPHPERAKPWASIDRSAGCSESVRCHKSGAPTSRWATCLTRPNP